MKRWWIGIVTVIALVLIGGSFCTVGQRSHYICIDCGMYYQDRVMFGIPMPSYQREQRTDWYDRRIGMPHEHRWTKTTCTAGLTIWQTPTYFACGKAEPLIDGKWAAIILARLEPLDLDVKYHRELTHQELKHREAATAGWQSFDPTWKDDQVLTWWRKTEKFLEDPSAWSEDFGKFGK